MFKKFKTLLISALLVCFCVPCFAYSSVKTGGINISLAKYLADSAVSKYPQEQRVGAQTADVPGPLLLYHLRLCL